MKSSKLWILLVFTLMLSATVKAETFFAYLSSAQEVPTNASTATGYARVFLNESAGTINYTVVFSGLSSNQTACHIHAPAAIGANSAVAVNFGAVGGTSGTITGTIAVTSTQIAQLRAHQGYVNLHSANFSGGEIRGQLGVKRPLDFDGDGRSDYSVVRGANTVYNYWTRFSSGGYDVVGFGNLQIDDTQVPGDYDGDGKDDRAFYYQSPFPNVQREFWILHSSDAVVERIFFGLSSDRAVNRDYDGDGKTDLAVFRRGATAGAQAYWYIRLSSTGTVSVIPFGISFGINPDFGDVPISGDFDGDGKFDIAVYRYGTEPRNTFIIRRSSDNTVSFTQFGNFDTDFVVPGDYDGDGKYDLAVARIIPAPTIVWWILESSTGTIRAQSFGKTLGANVSSTDRPVQGDYDGDGRTDIAVYRPLSQSDPGSFWVLNSFNNTTSNLVWGSVVGRYGIVNNFDVQ